MMMLSLAVACGDDEIGAYFHGAVRDQIPALARVLSPQQLEAHDATFERAQRSLGSERFDAQAQRGAALPPAAALEAALAYVDRARFAFDAVEAPPVDAPEGAGLTPRQREVVDLLVAGLSNKEIAARLGISPKTVMHHTTAIYQALGVRGRAEAAVAFVRMQTRQTQQTQ
jgi:DNA-binding NarL/FixJ family response regulator